MTVARGFENLDNGLCKVVQLGIVVVTMILVCVAYESTAITIPSVHVMVACSMSVKAASADAHVGMWAAEICRITVVVVRPSSRAMLRASSLITSCTLVA
jgi:hypothetical protein